MPASVSDLMDALEVAYSDYATARHAYGKAQADYQAVYDEARAHSKESSQAAKEADAKYVATDYKRKLIGAETMHDITQTHIRVLLGQLVAAQSQQKYAGKIDGGDW